MSLVRNRHRASQKSQAGSGLWASGGLDSPWIVPSGEIVHNPFGTVETCPDFTRIPPAGEMAKDRLRWLAELSKGFNRHHCGRGEWMQPQWVDAAAANGCGRGGWMVERCTGTA